MRLPNGFLRWAIVACGVFSARAAPAQTGERRILPPATPYVARGWLYGPGQGGIFWNVTARSVPIGGSVAETSLGVGLGITDRLSLDGSLGTIVLAPHVRSSGPQVGAWLGIVDTPPLEIDATAHVTFGAAGESTLAKYEPGAVAVIRPGPVRLDVSAYVPVTVDGGVGLRAPVMLAVQLGPYLHTAVTSGVTLSRIGDGSAALPFTLALGCSVPLGARGYAAVVPSVAWPTLVGRQGSDPGGPGVIEVGATVAIITPP